MAGFEYKPGYGGLFRQPNAKGNQPSHQGTVKDPEGNEWQIAAWVKEGKNGKYFSLKLSEPYKGGQRDRDIAAGPPPADEPEFDDSIPFAHAWIVPAAGLLCGLSMAGQYLV